MGHLQARKRLIMNAILAPTAVGLSELKKDPKAVLEASGDQPVAILSGDTLVGYVLSAAAWERIRDLLDDQELTQIAESRMTDGMKPIEVSLDDL